MTTTSQPEPSVADLFDQFIEANTMKNVLSLHHRIMNHAELSPCEFNLFYPKLKQAVLSNRPTKSWKAKALFSKIDKKASHRCYSNTKAPTPLGQRPKSNQQPQADCPPPTAGYFHNTNDALQHLNCLVIGAGPAGLRTAIELQLLGAQKVVVAEKRSRFSRNNVLHLWPFVIHDLKSLGAKKFYGKFCAGSIDHISIRQIQLMLLKVSLIIGCDFRDSCSYLGLCPASIKQPQGEQQQVCDLKDSDCSTLEFVRPVPVDHLQKDISAESSPAPTDERADVQQQDMKSSCDSIVRGQNIQGARAHFQSEFKSQEPELHQVEWDIIIGADGRRNTLGKFFPRKEFRGRLAIAITANFINHQTPTESAVPEISGLSFIYNQDMFHALADDANIHLENICYYKDDTHYFVMTAKKRSLLDRKVLIQDQPSTQHLLSEKNIDRQALLNYARDAAFWTTGLQPLNFALNHYGQEDCAMFDFTSMYAAVNACKALRTANGGLVLMSLVGDSLLEPFWPTGSGCARGFLSSLDSAWMCRQWAVNRCPVIEFQEHSSSRFNRNRSSVSDSFASVPTTNNRIALSVIAERESIYRILAQTTSENLQQTYSHWSLNPHSRYPNLNRYLIMPSQVDHLITGIDVRGSPTLRVPSSQEKSRRQKSPNSRKSPKKLKSANASPQNQTRKSYGLKSRSRNDLDSYLALESSYDNLINSAHDPSYYLNYRSDLDNDENLSVPSISGISPSANNLMSLEAKRSRDIDECLRLRRQKAQLSVVKDELKQQLRQEFASKGNSVILNELRRYREQKLALRGKDNNSQQDEVRPLTLLNSIRRCASFAERVKSFENRTNSIERDQAPVTPRTPIDTVKNLPEFATLQELFSSKSSDNNDSSTIRKLKMPIMKLSKEDWNVKCWESRLSAYKQRNTWCGSTKSLNKALSVDSYVESSTTVDNGVAVSKRSEKQVEVFKGRIREMADKLNNTGEKSSLQLAMNRFKKLEASQAKSKSSTLTTATDRFNLSATTGTGKAKGWVSHVQSELIKGCGSSANRHHSHFQQQDKSSLYKSSLSATKDKTSSQLSKNPFAPQRTIKKLFQDDDADQENHYDHLCLTRPTNKYLQRNAYTSHLARTKIDTSTARVIDRQPPTASKAAYLAAISSKDKSGSVSNSSHSGRHNSNGSASYRSTYTGAPPEIVRCFRCRDTIGLSDKISIGDISLHRACLMCAKCGITLRTSEIQHYLQADNDSNSDDDSSFVCSICQPSIRDDLTKEAASRDAQVGLQTSSTANLSDRLSSREQFLSQQIDYNVLYKNIIDESKPKDRHYGLQQQVATLSDRSTVVGESNLQTNMSSPSPIEFTLPIELVSSDCSNRLNSQPDRPESSKSSSEQVTLVLPPTPSNERPVISKQMMDEEELNRILLLDTSTSKHDDECLSSSSSDDDRAHDKPTETVDSDVGDDSSACDDEEEDEEKDEQEEEQAERSRRTEVDNQDSDEELRRVSQSEGSTSLESAQSSDYEDADSDDHQDEEADEDEEKLVPEVTSNNHDKQSLQVEE